MPDINSLYKSPAETIRPEIKVIEFGSVVLFRIFANNSRTGVDGKRVGRHRGVLKETKAENRQRERVSVQK